MALLIEFDKAGAEWVVVAYASGDGRMIEVIEQGKSPHVITGALISGAPEDLIQQEDDLLGHMTDPEILAAERSKQIPALLEGDYFLPRSMTIRQAGKKSNHGLNYGMKYRRFALENEIEETDARKIVESYTKKAYLNIPKWWESIQRQLHKDRTLVNCFGRKRTFMDAWGVALFEQAYAFIPQSTVVDITFRAIRSFWDNRTQLRDWEMLAQVHDSILFQYHGSDWLDMAETARWLALAEDCLNPRMEYGGREFQIGTTAKIGYHWDESMQPWHIEQDVTATHRNLLASLERLHGREKKAG